MYLLTLNAYAEKIPSYLKCSCLVYQRIDASYEEKSLKDTRFASTAVCVAEEEESLKGASNTEGDAEK